MLKAIAARDPEDQETPMVPTAAPSAATLSVLIPTFETATDPAALIRDLKAALDGRPAPAEIVVAGGKGIRDRAEAARAAAAGWTEVIAVVSTVAPDEEEALKHALSRATGDTILTLPGWRVPSAAGLAPMFDALDAGHDLVAGSTVDPETAARLPWRRRIFHNSVGRLFGTRFNDLFCRVRLGRRAVFAETAALGVRQHFLPVVADWRGFDVAEVTLPRPETPGSFHRAFSVSGHFRAMVDLLMLYVVLKFLHRPLRFFSAIGAPLVVLGVLVTGVLVLARLFQLTALSDRPLLTFGMLSIVLGVQIIAIGLVGEIIVFTSNRRARTYEVSRRTDDPADDAWSGDAWSGETGSAHTGSGHTGSGKTGRARDPHDDRTGDAD